MSSTLFIRTLCDTARRVTVFYTKHEIPPVEDIEYLLNPDAFKRPPIEASVSKAEKIDSERLAFLEETLFNLIETLRENNVINPTYGRYQGFPVGMILYSQFDPKNNNKKTLKVESDKFVLNTGIETNSMSEAMKLVAPKANDPWVYWRVGGHRGPTIGEVFGYLNKD